MSDSDEIENRLNKEKSKLMNLEIKINAIDSDTYFYQRKNNLDKVNELAKQKENLIDQYNSQKQLVEDLQKEVDSLSFNADEINTQKEELINEQEKIVREKNKDAPQENQEKIIQKSHENNTQKETFNHPKTYFTKTDNNKGYQLLCPKCGEIDNGKDSFCQSCGYQLRNIKPEDDNKNNWFVKYFLKKKKDDGSYRFSISKIIGFIWAVLQFFYALVNYYFPESIIVGIVAACFIYIICLICGYLVRFGYKMIVK